MKTGKAAAVLCVALMLLAIGALGGAARSHASVDPATCADRPFCVTLEDQDNQSRSLEAPHYMKYVLTISRNPDGGTSQLTNGRATLTLTDVIGEDDATTTDPDDPADVPSNAVFQEDPSDSRCSAGTGQSKHIVTCTVPNLPAGALALEYKPLIFTTTNRTEAASPFTRSVADVTFKEKGSDNQPNDPNVDSAVVTNPTRYERLDDLDSSWAFRKATINLATSSTADEQHTSFKFAVPDTAAAPAFTASVSETPVAQVAAGDNPCGTNTCYGEIATTNTGTNSSVLFSATNPAHVTIVWDFKPSGFTENGGTAYHMLDGGAVEPPITQKCTFAQNARTPTTLPCRTINIQNLGGGQVLVTTDIWSASNGGWGVG